MSAADTAAVYRQVDQFRNPDAGGVEQVQHGVVTQDKRTGFFGQSQHPFYLFNGQGMGQAAADFWRVNLSYRVAVHQVSAGEKLKKSTQGGESPGITAGADISLKAVLEKGADMFAVDPVRSGNSTAVQEFNKKMKI